MGLEGRDHIFLVATGCCLLAVTISGIVLVKFILDRLAARKLRLKKRNSLQKYPSFVANKITGVITILPPTGPRRSFDSQFTKFPQQYIIAVGPPLDWYNSNLSLYERLYAYPGRAKRAYSEGSVSWSGSSYSSDIELDDTNNSNNNYSQPPDQHIISEMVDENNNDVHPNHQEPDGNFYKK